MNVNEVIAALTEAKANVGGDAPLQLDGVQVVSLVAESGAVRVRVKEGNFVRLAPARPAPLERAEGRDREPEWDYDIARLGNWAVSVRRGADGALVFDAWYCNVPLTWGLSSEALYQDVQHVQNKDDLSDICAMLASAQRRYADITAAAG
jgi:hypothetical protein